MTKIEKVIREISDLLEFYKRISKEKKQFKDKKASLLPGNPPIGQVNNQFSQDNITSRS